MRAFLQPNGPYMLAAQLTGHSDAIYALAVSPSGDLLASGGGDGIGIWDLRTYNHISWLSKSRSYHGPVTCMNWITRQEDPFNTLAYGTGLGYLEIWRQTSSAGAFEALVGKQVTFGKEIICLASDTGGIVTRLTLGTRDSVVQVYTINPAGELYSIFSVVLEDTVPISIGFVDNTAKDVFIFGMYCGQKYTLRGDDGKVLSTVSITGMIGSAAANCAKNEVVVDSVINGFDIYQLDSGTWKRNFTIGHPSCKMPKQVAFGEGSKIVVRGSDHGVVYVFDRKTASSVQVLRHSDRGMVQAMTTHDAEDTSTIASASSSTCGVVSISVWVRRFPANKPLDANHRAASHARRSIGDMVTHLLLILVTLIVLYQNFPQSQYLSLSGATVWMERQAEAWLSPIRESFDQPNLPVAPRLNWHEMAEQLMKDHKEEAEEQLKERFKAWVDKKSFVSVITGDADSEPKPPHSTGRGAHVITETRIEPRITQAQVGQDAHTPITEAHVVNTFTDITHFADSVADRDDHDTHVDIPVAN